MTHRLITVSYDLFADNNQGIHEQLEKAPTDYPFQFITNLGMSNEAFESRVADLNKGDKFDFTLSVEESNGPYFEDRVIDFPKSMFCVDGRFMADEIYPGNVIPLVNEDGNRFMGLVVRVEDETVRIDLNAPYAGRSFHYRGEIIDAREATNEEIQGAINMMSGGGCGCGCDECGGGCGGDHEGDCCGGHGHHDEDGHCCGGHGHHHEDGHCCGHHK